MSTSVLDLQPDEAELRCPECFASWQLFIPRRMKFTSRFVECVVCNERFWDEAQSPQGAER